MIDKGEVFILDVRRPDEYASGHIKIPHCCSPGYPANELDIKLKELPKINDPCILQVRKSKRCSKHDPRRQRFFARL